MHIHCELVILMLALTLKDQVHTGEIIGGHVAKANSSPYMVLVERTKPNGQIKYCGGFLLSKNFVMTAAHCNASSHRVFLGLHNFQNQKNVQVIPVQKSFPHSDYDYKDDQNYRNDFMLLKLVKEAKVSHSVKPIPLAGLGDNPSQSCLVSGWGRHDESGEMSSLLQEVNVSLIDKMPCDNEYFYCSDGRSGPAEGDSGGPLVCEDGKAYGVVSFYRGFQNIPNTRFYAKIPKARDWIDSIMASN